MPSQKLPTYACEVNTAVEYLLEEYCSEDCDITESINKINLKETSAEYRAEEEKKWLLF